VTVELWAAAFQRFVDALNQPRDAARLRLALVDDIRVDRHAPGERGVGPIAEIFRGIERVASWLGRTPATIEFTLAVAPWLDADGAVCAHYAIHAGEFDNGGLWVARLGPDHRFTFLSHHPFALRDEAP
jgi:hypothetical protein